MKFDKVFAEQYINNLLQEHNITVRKWSAGSCGVAWWKTRDVKIPHPTSVDRFAVCLHEIKHIIDGDKGRRFVQEFNCDMYALTILKELGYPTKKWIIRMKWHTLSRIAMAHNRGLALDKIPKSIRKFFKEIDFSKWQGMKVFVGHAYYKSNNPKDIILQPKYEYV